MEGKGRQSLGKTVFLDYKKLDYSVFTDKAANSANQRSKANFAAVCFGNVLREAMAV